MHDLSKIRVGQEILVDGRRYARCSDCRKIVRLDKPLIGSWHSCVPDEGDR